MVEAGSKKHTAEGGELGRGRGRDGWEGLEGCRSVDGGVAARA